jgi:hypothetical protein
MGVLPGTLPYAIEHAHVEQRWLEDGRQQDQCPSCACAGNWSVAQRDQGSTTPPKPRGVRGSHLASIDNDALWVGFFFACRDEELRNMDDLIETLTSWIKDGSTCLWGVLGRTLFAILNDIYNDARGWRFHRPAAITNALASEGNKLAFFFFPFFVVKLLLDFPREMNIFQLKLSFQFFLFGECDGNKCPPKAASHDGVCQIGHG